MDISHHPKQTTTTTTTRSLSKGHQDHQDTTMNPFPYEEYYAKKVDARLLNVTFEFLRDMPQELHELKEFFWDNWSILKPIEDMVYPHSNGVRNPENFWECEMAEGFLDSKGQGWIRVDFNREEVCAWWTYEQAMRNDPVQLTYKVLYYGWIYHDRYWWRICEEEPVFWIEDVIDLVEDEVDTKTEAVV